MEWLIGEIVTGCYWCSDGINCCCFERRLRWYHWLVNPLECWWASSLSWRGPRAEDSFRVVYDKDVCGQPCLELNSLAIFRKSCPSPLQGFLHEIWTPLTGRYVCHLAGGSLWLSCILSTLTARTSLKIKLTWSTGSNRATGAVPLGNNNENSGLNSFNVHLNLHF